MNQGGSSNAEKRNKHTKVAMALGLVFLILAAVGTTIAYLVISSNAVVNDFSPATVTCQIDEIVNDGIKSSVKVQNTGSTGAYIRVAVIANSVNGDGEIIGSADVSSALCGAGWVPSGLYYYYTQPVSAGAKTGELLSDSIDLDGIQVTVLAEAIQAEPTDVVLDAWGVSPASLAD